MKKEDSTFIVLTIKMNLFVRNIFIIEIKVCLEFSVSINTICLWSMVQNEMDIE